MDPRTMRPSDASLSVTVIGPDATLADAISTAAFVLGPQQGLALINSFPDVAGLIVYRDADGKTAVTMTPALEGRFQKIGKTP
jgi:thiamine biosynthesis lipoprotein